MKKRGFLALALVTTTAGVASAFAPGSQDSGRAAAGDRTCDAGGRQAACRHPAGNHSRAGRQESVLEARRAPVPLLMKPRATIEPPIFDADAVGPDVPAKFSGGSGESAAKAAIEADGYKRAKVVRQGDNGIWYAKAMRGTTEVSLTVDAGGRVSLE